MGTSLAVMTARQSGKSIFGKKATAVWIDEWDTIDNSKTEKPIEYLEFTTPPLAIVVAMHEAGKSGVEIYETLERVGKQLDSTTKINIEHQAQAAEIYDYFAKKHTMRRIKGEFVSEYMLAVDDLIENRNKINKEHVKILVSLVRIYEQNRSLEHVMKGCKSVPKNKSLEYPKFDGVVEFVDKFKIKSNGNNEIHYFWKTPNNYLMRVVLGANEYGVPAWNAFAACGKIKVSSNVTYVYPIRGYAFNVMQASPQHMEINIL